MSQERQEPDKINFVDVRLQPIFPNYDTSRLAKSVPGKTWAADYSAHQIMMAGIFLRCQLNQPFTIRDVPNIWSRPTLAYRLNYPHKIVMDPRESQYVEAIISHLKDGESIASIHIVTLLESRGQPFKAVKAGIVNKTGDPAAFILSRQPMMTTVQRDFRAEIDPPIAAAYI